MHSRGPILRLIAVVLACVLALTVAAPAPAEAEVLTAIAIAGVAVGVLILVVFLVVANLADKKVSERVPVYFACVEVEGRLEGCRSLAGESVPDAPVFLTPASLPQS